MGNRAQSALEYLLTYSWAILIIAIIIGLLYYFVVVPPTVTPTTCTFTVGVSCQDLVLGPQGNGDALRMVLTNQQSTPIYAPSVTTNISGMLYPGTCMPNYVLPGGAMLCNVTIPTSLGMVNNLVFGQLQLLYKPCQSGNVITCSSAPTRTITGSFDTHIEAVAPLAASIMITLAAANTVWPADGSKDQLTATVTFNGAPIPGATVNFSESPTFATLSPRYSSTDTSGNAISYISSVTAGSESVNAQFSNSIASIVIMFTTTSTTSTTTTSSSTSSSSTSTSSSTTSTTSSSTTTTTSCVDCFFGEAYYAPLSSRGIGDLTSNWIATNGYFIGDQPGCSAYDGYMYCVGGDQQFYDTPTNDVAFAQILPDGEGLGPWQLTTSLPQPAAQSQDVSCVTYSGEIYCVGGDTGGDPFSGAGAVNAYYAPLSAINGQVGTWVQTTSIPSPFNTSGMACTPEAGNGYIYCVNGWNGVTAITTANVIVGTLVSGGGISAWTISPNPYPDNVFETSCAASGTNLYCTDGENATSVGHWNPINASFSANIQDTSVSGWSQQANNIMNQIIAPPSFNITEPFCDFYSEDVYCVGGISHYSFAYHVTDNASYGGEEGPTLPFWTATNSYPGGADDGEWCAIYNGYIYCTGSLNV